MAKRRRLSPAAALADPDHGPGSAPVSASVSSPAPAIARRPPIAEVAGDAAARAALDDLAGELAAARAEGRLIQDLPLAEVHAGHLVRDRIAAEDADMAALRASIAARGQQVPIEVADLGPGHGPLRYGLISGWRRLTALRSLHAETGEDRFATVKAVLRRPDTASDAYVAMVEENEIRVGLSYYERARVAARAAEAGVFEDVPAAIRTLFAAASKAKRSKIASFVSIYRELDEVLAHPAAIPERLGLKLARALQEGHGRAIREGLMFDAAGDAEAELASLTRALGRIGRGPAKADTAPGRSPPEVIPGIRMKRGRTGLTLSGPGVDAGLEEALAAWLKGRG
ncbi:ParB N-terminal domain-containing protein [Rhodobacterales bacterium HKCCE2091]|nr:ParB N-terminal domain-containing protein [Rhodobacterales bacterium HKCCE2091]